jgi:hypothetical protein
LHDSLKDVFREESWVHIVHGDDGWEESDEAWELGEEEAMIVGTVRQEAEGSWQDVCNTWATQDEDVEAGVHHVEADQKTNSMEPLEEGGLLVEGEEREYILKLLMRRASPDQPAENLLPKSETSALRGRKNKNLVKKIRRKKLLRGAAGKEPRKEKTTDPTGGAERRVASNLAHNPEVKGRGLTRGGPQKRDQVAVPPPTSGGECSG